MSVISLGNSGWMGRSCETLVFFFFIYIYIYISFAFTNFFLVIILWIILQSRISCLWLCLFDTTKVSLLIENYIQLSTQRQVHWNVSTDWKSSSTQRQVHGNVILINQLFAARRVFIWDFSFILNIESVMILGQLND